MLSVLTFCVAFSTHVGVSRDFNEIHPCVKLEYDKFTVGAFLNSYGDTTGYLSYTLGDKLWVEGGAAVGYPQAPVVPFLRAGYSFTDGVSLFVAPVPARGGVGAVFGVELEF